MADLEHVDRGYSLIVRWARRRYEGIGARVTIDREPGGSVVVTATHGGRKETTTIDLAGMHTKGSLGMGNDVA